MRSVVVDASALVALALDEPAGKDVARRLDGAALYAPWLLKFEVANAVWKKTRRDPVNGPGRVRALEKVLDPRWGITWMEVDHADTVAISLATGLSVYDASYVWLAGVLGADLVTLDERLMSVTG